MVEHGTLQQVSRRRCRRGRYGRLAGRCRCSWRGRLGGPASARTLVGRRRLLLRLPFCPWPTAPWPRIPLINSIIQSPHGASGRLGDPGSELVLGGTSHLQAAADGMLRRRCDWLLPIVITRCKDGRVAARGPFSSQ